ncbi:MAG: biotin/lipoyl-binding protein, partial [Leptolyngbya sp. SIO1D8]|nr:biotin/lipoyl-binding protein [Leptolyngbya sp. SIO1D8]
MGQLKQQTTGKSFWLRLRPQGKPAPEGKTTSTEVIRPRLKLPHWLPYGLVGFGVAVLVVLAFRPTPLAVDVGMVTQGPLQVTVDAEGKTRVQDRYVVAAPVDGRLQRIDLEAGDPVEAGMVVAQIDPLPLDTQVST